MAYRDRIVRLFRFMAVPIFVLGVAACSAVPVQADRLALQTRAAPTSPAAFDAIPATIAEYWSGRGRCLLTADNLDQTARQNLAVLERYSAPAKVSAIGLQLDQSPQLLIRAFVKLTRNVPAADMRRLVGDCRTVYCAMARIFGEPAGLRILYLYLRYNYNASHLAYPDTRAWTAIELGDLILALQDMPDSIAPFYLQPVRALVGEADHGRIAAHFPSGQPNIVAFADRSSALGIRTFAAWNGLPQHSRRAAMFHELAHDFFRQQSLLVDAQGIWRRAMAEDAALQARLGHRAMGVSAYAEQSIFEDFAESAVAYRYAPELILEHQPNRAKLLKIWMFDELSYESQAACQPARSLTNRAAVAAFQRMPELDISPGTRAAIVNECQRLMRDTADAMRVTAGRLCVGRELYRVALSKSLQQILGNNDALDRITARRANRQFLDHGFGSIDNARILALTDAKALKNCGATCHGPGK